MATETMTQERREETCPECGGGGLKLYRSKVAWFDGTVIMSVRGNCNRCSGTGRILKPKEGDDDSR